MESSTPHPSETSQNVPGPSGEWSVIHCSHQCVRVVIILLSNQVLVLFQWSPPHLILLKPLGMVSLDLVVSGVHV